MLWYYVVGGSSIAALITGYLWGNKVGHQQEIQSKTAQSAQLDAEIAQKKQWIQKLTESYETYKKLEKNAENNLNLETERLLKIREQRLLAPNQALAERERKLDEREATIKKDKETFQSILHASIATTPFFAKQISDFLYMQDLKDADYLTSKSHPAFSAASKVREIAAQKRVLQEQCKLQEYQLNLYETAFPWLSDFKEISSEDLQTLSSLTISESDYDSSRDYLSKEEYQSLSVCERNQLALDRFRNSRKRTKWQVGRDYELYIGYRYTQKGYSVDYFGSYMGLEDLGRDLIAKKDGSILIIQCKYWSSQKQIHEKHVTQLYGTMISYSIENNVDQSKIKGVLVTNIQLSDTAKTFSERLGIGYAENVEAGDYPCIKCNIGRDEFGSTYIYHLPFDQQYDAVKIDSPGEFYAMTVAEAEAAGFRRARKWFGNQ